MSGTQFKRLSRRRVTQPLIEAATMKSFVDSIAESLGSAQAAISHSVFSTEFLEGIRTITAGYEAQTARINAAMTWVAEHFKPLSLTVDVTQFADLFRSVELTGFYESFKHRGDDARGPGCDGHRKRRQDRREVDPKSSRQPGFVNHCSMILVCGHPCADVRRTVPKHNAIGGFVIAKVANGVAIGENQIREVQRRDGSGRFCVDQVAQLAHVLDIQSTADHEHEGRVHPALNLQQRHDRA